jgi:hypothetical protein
LHEEVIETTRTNSSLPSSSSGSGATRIKRSTSTIAAHSIADAGNQAIRRLAPAR